MALPARSLLEALKWLPASDLLGSSLVSHFWRDLAESEDVWSALLAAKSQGLIHSQTRNLFTSSKETYRALYTKISVYVVILGRYAEFDIDKKTHRIGNLASPTKITKGSYMLLLPDRSIFACGGDTYSDQRYDNGLTCSYRILPINFTVETLADMSVRRRYPGAYYYKGDVYVFGGIDNQSDNSSAELYTLSKNSWTNLPDANYGRNGFTPVMFCLEIFLVGGSKNTIEAFHVEKKTYRVLPIQLPGIADCTCIVSGDSLTAFSMQKALEIDLWTEKVVSTRTIPSLNSVWSTVQPLLVKGKMWFYYWHHETIVSYDLRGMFTPHESFRFSDLPAKIGSS